MCYLEKIKNLTSAPTSARGASVILHEVRLVLEIYTVQMCWHAREY